MRLTKLEINGFKSFARKTELLFGQGITAVIGPNGSGKSNIADAIRWVLGEQSAKALRGAKMEDVIFSGTQERKAQAFCEVALTFDNADGRLPVEFTEVTIQRRVYRSGESEYMINRNVCRLKDIQELFRDTGIGKEGYSIIGQGKVEEILSNKSNERRAAFEEAAGVMRYRVRKEEAERKLENTRKNLVRLEDILGELTLQLEPLEKQSQDARKYLQLRDELKELELNVFLNQYEKYQERIANQNATMAQLEEEEHQLGAMEQQLAAESVGKEDELQALEVTISNLQNELINLMSGAESHLGEYKVLQERAEGLLRERQRLEAAIAHEHDRRANLQQTLDAMQDGDDTGKALLQALDQRIQAREHAAKEAEAQILAQEEQLTKLKNSVMEAMNRLSDAKSQLSRLEAMTTAFQGRLQAIQNDQAEIEQEHQTLLVEEKEALREAGLQQQQRQALVDQTAVLKQQQALAVQQRNESHQTLRQLEHTRDTLRSRQNVLEEMAKAHEGYYSSVRNVLRDAQRDISLKRCILGVVAELIQVPKEYETAVEMALGSALQNIVTPTPEDAKQVIDHLRTHQYGRATLLPVSSMRARLLTPQERETLHSKGCIGLACELVKFDPQYRSVVENLLGRTVIVEDLDAGIALNKLSGAAFRIATCQGDMIHPGGSMTGGSVQKREFSLLGREREIKELKTRLIAVEQEMIQAQQKQEAQEKSLEALGDQLESLAQQMHQQELQHTRDQEKLEMIQRDIRINREKYQRCCLEQEQIQDNLRDIQEDREGMLQQQSGIEQGNAATQEDVQQAQEALNALRRNQEQQNAQLTEDKVQRMALQKEEDAARAERKRLQKELLDAQKMASDHQQALLHNAQEQSELAQKQETLQRYIGVEQKDVNDKKEQQHCLEEERAKRSKALSEMRARKDELSTRIRDISDRRHRQELNKSRTEMELGAMQDRIWEDYQLTYDNVLPFKKQIAITAAHVRIDELKAGIRELGNINVNAIEDYETIFARHQELQTQCQDLNQAETDLQALILELTNTMQRQFLEQFERIQENFSLVFQQLFGGGYAELRLGDREDVLNCDIDIIAQPPGKKLQLLSLLSGGERALTAIALLFAMLKLKPTAFCVLDEIESSLDEVNVTRFANYLKDYADDTQFIIITHRKGSMEVCNALYGVAMEERGVSKVVSAQFYDNAS